MSADNIRILNITSEKDAIAELNKIGVDKGGIKIMAPKMIHLNVKIRGIDIRQAHIIKQRMLAIGADAAVHRDVITNNIDHTDTILMATKKQLMQAVKKLRKQPFGLKKLAENLNDIINLDYFKLKPIRCGNKKFDFNKNIYIMGILNVTPDSFSDGGRFFRQKDALMHVENMVIKGADIIDVGGESTRPGSEPVSAKEEIKRVIPVIKDIKSNFNIPVSIDTYKSDVAKAAIDAGADVINDISAMNFDSDMKKTAADSGVPVILMHIKGTPKDMQKNPKYGCVITEIIDYLTKSINDAISAGVKEDNIIIDPGIGFGKTLRHNIEIIRNLSEFKSLIKPILVGLSRKSMIGTITDKNANERLYGSLAANVISVQNGANILRVHDVDETVQAVKTAKALM